MLGHSHALSGGVTGLATGLFLQFSFPQTVALAGFTAGMALLPDLDKCGSSPARCLGFLSEAVAWIIGRLTGGHRHLTHSILGIAGFTALAWYSCQYRHDWVGKAGLALLMTLTVSAGLEALRVARRPHRRPDRHRDRVLGGLVRVRAAADPDRGVRRLLHAHRRGHADRLRLHAAVSAVPAALPPAARAAGVHHRDPAGTARRGSAADRGAGPADRLGRRPGLHRGALARRGRANRADAER